ncbi:LOW QUALITY PROTEIN: transmembrane 4 L6 family member 1 [Pholidichthys leucotaenia]
MCVSRCLRCVGMSLVPMAIVCMLSNILLLLPGLQVHFLLEGHVTREATWATGLWGSGFLVWVLVGARAFFQSSKTVGCCAFRSQMLCQVLYACLCLRASGCCCLVSASGLTQGPLCLYNAFLGVLPGVSPLQPIPDRHSGYLNNRTLWSGVCLEPTSVVEWNVVLFSMMGITSGLRVLCGANVLSLLGMILERASAKTRVCVQVFFVWFRNASSLGSISEERRSMMIQFLGAEGQRVFFGLCQVSSLEDGLKAIDSTFDDTSTVTERRCEFFGQQQRTGESLQSFVLELHGLARKCEFDALEHKLVRDKLAQSTSSTWLKNKLKVAKEPLSLEEVLDLIK